MPAILVLRSIGTPPIDTVETDNRHAGGQAARMLHDLGHRNIGLVMGPQDTSTSRDRAQGALSCLIGAGVPRGCVHLLWGTYSSDSGYSATKSLRSEPDPVTARTSFPEAWRNA
jgi:LacI family transcriptional regulator